MWVQGVPVVNSSVRVSSSSAHPAKFGGGIAPRSRVDTLQGPEKKQRPKEGTSRNKVNRPETVLLSTAVKDAGICDT
ncbi:Hypothetical predicted protein [Podarcis lilfordi]|uniref:Uncharacterized protein n=1 Tax=Podarcis lilfordi TaxID=74358 RepID=A0AA35L411_9SAUR|nr:Hypothetical predicted protein [Podarcis lilfordi]